MSLFSIGFVIFPDLTQLDFTGPLQVLSWLPQSATHIVAKSAAPVPSDCGLGLVPTHTFANCPPLDLICIPGGSEGVAGIINDHETIEFVRQQAGAAKYVTSVCTGAFALGVAGLLKGRRATTHWAYTDLLPLVGATYEKARVVKDGNVITGGGVTAGIDFGLSVIAEIAGETTARRIQLGIEYDPAPPFDSGHPDKAPTIKSELLSARCNEFRAMYRTRIAQAALTAMSAFGIKRTWRLAPFMSASGPEETSCRGVKARICLRLSIVVNRPGATCSDAMPADSR
jgi:cyclohexyl-isocyanide hydratase